MRQTRTRRWLPPQGLLVGYSGLLASVAGYVNAVAILVLAFPVGNLTGVTTELGMDTANPWLYEGHVLAAILSGFLAGTTAAGAILAASQAQTGTRHAAVLIAEAGLLLFAAVGVENAAVKAQISAVGIHSAVVQALFAAAALGLQNGLTSSIRGMSIRTTHFTGTVTDLGLMLGRSRRHGIDKWKAAVLTATLVLFLIGGVAGLLIGNRLGGYALVVPAATCLVVAVASVLHSRGRRRRSLVLTEREPIQANSG
ncbi:DUF1275 domain-containing protein [Mycobacterium avium subsp. hominissuis]|nr:MULTISPECIES: YoaK family protein [Mycobacterium avium complex (MAC)]ASX03596.1 DUF1275 domain-containing protein [Mycobacterium intracellulare subsp. chimaera]PBA61385.1 DUF1275 domain-containing protein [Mycobacterium intracellulare subsp. chimaera]PBJ65358.1 DUF1275 domain-containing protein [Mycobacterium avium subsp. hominissuis]QWY63800.1 DUF1275 domain-containing protein [Mycobacterium avium subsp. hominissuis]QWY65118.1 DUF1275 domain-containing protein [Mycobacterium avium subsp. h